MLAPINPYYGGWGFPGNGGFYGLGSRYAGVGRGVALPYGGLGYGAGYGAGYLPLGLGYGRRHGRHYALDNCYGGLYRNEIVNGKSRRRCLFGKQGHLLGGWYGWGSWPWGGYGDFVGHGSHGGNVGSHRGIFAPSAWGAYSKGGIPKGEEEEDGESKTRQGVVYPYVGYGPWSSYPWWADWWGGHGHHGWGEHGGHGVGHVGAHVGGHGIGLHCRDVVTKGDKSKKSSKRFCVPIGYHGGYGDPFWHGYPGAGLGMWGWGWPWIKSKVPSNGKKADAKLASKPEDKTEKKPEKAAAKDEKKEEKPTQRDQIPSADKKKEKKQTIHVGYGYASGDNYRLGYGFGGMGGVSGFSGAAPHGGMNFDDGHAAGAPFKKSELPKKESASNAAASSKKSELPSQKETSPMPEDAKQVSYC